MFELKIGVFDNVTIELLCLCKKFLTLDGFLVKLIDGLTVLSLKKGGDSASKIRINTCFFDQKIQNIRLGL